MFVIMEVIYIHDLKDKIRILLILHVKSHRIDTKIKVSWLLIVVIFKTVITLKHRQ